MVNDKNQARFGTDLDGDLQRDEAPATQARARDAESRHDDDPGQIVLHEERLVAATEKVATGVVRVRVKVVTEEQTVTVALRKQVLEVIEDTEVEGVENPQGLRKAREIVLHEDRIVVETVPYEKVRIARRKVREQQTFEAEVAREVLEVHDASRVDEPRRVDGDAQLR